MLGTLQKTVKSGHEKVQSNLKGAFAQFNFLKKSSNISSSNDSSDNGDDDERTWMKKIKNVHAAGAVRFKNVFVAPILNVNALLGFEPPVHFKTESESTFLHTTLTEQAFVYSRLGMKEQKALVRAFVKNSVSDGTVLYREGEPGLNMYVLQTGTVTFTSTDPGMDDTTVSGGYVFGELALLHDAPLVSTAKAGKNCVVWKLDGETARKILASYAIGSDSETKDLLKKVPLLKNLDDTFLTQIAYALTPTTYKDGEVIYTKGDTNVSFCIVQSGIAKATDVVIGETKYDEVSLKPGESFGVLAIINNEPAQGHVTAVGETTLLALSREVFLRLFGGMDKLLQASVDRKMLVSTVLVCVCGCVCWDDGGCNS